MTAKASSLTRFRSITAQTAEEGLYVRCKSMKKILCTIIGAGLIPLLLVGLIIECLLGQRVDLFKEDER